MKEIKFNEENIIIVNGKLATGKTTCAINLSIDMLNKEHNEIYIYNTIQNAICHTTLDIGFVPGVFQEKNFNLLRHIYTVLNNISIERNIEYDEKSKYIINKFNITNIYKTPTHLHFDGENSLDNKIVVIDQSQILNEDYTYFLKLLAKSKAKIILIGDMQQDGIKNGIFDTLSKKENINTILMKTKLRKH